MAPRRRYSLNESMDSMNRDGEPDGLVIWLVNLSLTSESHFYGCLRLG